ncbi:hypothetical protein FQN51_001921 [Onygenales sp. PD_10]|nr:hypothetical protein FQN51_001921 [Onygenales sp. PD_10]
MDTPALVHAFNNLPRRPKVPSGTVDNHWHFNVHHVPLQPPGDLLFLLNPASLYIHVEGPKQIGNLTSPSARADIILPLLLKSFVTGLQQGGPSELAPFAPWSWSTKDEALARALEEKLRAVGVREELCSVAVADQTLNDLDQERWGEFMKGLTGMARKDGNSGAPAPTTFVQLAKKVLGQGPRAYVLAPAAKP